MTSVGVLMFCGEAVRRPLREARARCRAVHGAPPNSHSVNHSSSVASAIDSRLNTPSWRDRRLEAIRVADEPVHGVAAVARAGNALSCASTYGSFTTASNTASRSVITLPPQSCVISSTNFWPKPNEPRGFGATTTQPCAAQSDVVPARRPPVAPVALRTAVDQEDDRVFLRRVEVRRLDDPVLHRRAARRRRR